MVANDDNPIAARRRKRLQEALSEAVPTSPPPAGTPTPRRRTPPALSVVGSGNIIGDGNTINNHFSEPPRIIKNVTVKTGDGVLDASQKRIIMDLVYEIVDVEAAVKRDPRDRQAVWSALNRRFKVNTYHEIKSDDFEAAVKYLRMQLGRLRSAKSAPKKDPNWRKGRIRAIQARSKEFPDGDERRRAYMQKHFGASSLTDLDDSQVEQVYRHVFGWR